MTKIFLATADHCGRLEELFFHHSSGLNFAEVPAAQARYAGSSTLRFSKSLDVMKGIDSGNASKEVAVVAAQAVSPRMCVSSLCFLSAEAISRSLASFATIFVLLVTCLFDRMWFERVLIFSPSTSLHAKQNS